MINIFYILIILVINLISAVFFSLRYRYVLNYLGEHIKATSAFLIFCLSGTINYLIPFKGGIFVGGPTAAKLKENISVEKSSIVLIFEQLFEAIWQLIFIIFFFIFAGNKIFKNHPLFNIIFLSIMLIIILYFVFRHDKLLNILIKIHVFLPKKLKNFINKIGIKKENTSEAFKNLKLLFTKKSFLLNYSLRTVFLIFFTPLNLLFILMAFSYYFSYLDIIIMFWTSFILGKLSGLPGGLGLRDLAIGAFLVNLGISTTLTVQIVFLHRILSLFPVIPVGGTLLIYLSKGKLTEFYKRFL